MANDNISIRSTSRTDVGTTLADSGKFSLKNQVSGGASALDGLFGASAESSFGRVLDSQVKRDPAANARPLERKDPPRHDKAGRPGGKHSPHTRAESRAADNAEARTVKERPSSTARKNTDTAAATNAEQRPLKQKSTTKPEQATPTEADASARSNEQATAVQAQPVQETPEAMVSGMIAASQLTEQDAALNEATDAASVDTPDIAQARLAMLQLAGAGADEKLNAAALAQAEKSAGSAHHGNATGLAHAATVSEADKLAALLANTSEQEEASAEVDPALKDLINAMINARTRPSNSSELPAQPPSVTGESISALARELNQGARPAAWMAAAGPGMTETAGLAEQLANEVSLVGLTTQEAVDEVVPLLPDEAATLDPAVTETSPDLLLTAESTEDGADTNAAERQTRSSAERPVPMMGAAISAEDAGAADSDSWSILNRMADALPKNMPKETAETLKNVTPQVQPEQQVNLVRNELRNLERLVDASLQGRSTRDPGKDDKGLEVKTASLSRAIENLGGTVKNADLRPAMPVTNTPVMFGRTGFAEQMAEKIMLMTTQKIQTAEIRLDPKELGTVDIKIRVHQDQATVVFSSPNAQVRDALENSIPRLREMFADSGVGLGSVNVNDRGGSAAGGNEQSQGQGGNAAFAGVEETNDERPQRQPRQTDGLVDYYA